MLSADHDTRAGAVNGDAGLLGGALDHDTGNAGLDKARHQILAQAQIFMKQVAVVLTGKPAAVPGTVDAEPKPDRIDLLTHYACSSSRSRTMTVRLLNAFWIPAERPRPRA